MRLACTLADGPGDTDLLLERVANTLLARGLRVQGTVQVNSNDTCEGPCDMDVRILPDGPVIRISQSLGRHSKGCRLNAAALESAVGLVGAGLSPTTDLLIVNKFGKHEANGHGFRALIADAAGLDIPVLVGTNRLNHAALVEFSGGLAQTLPPDAASIIDWATADRLQSAVV